jgi:hypothetical protein
VAWEGWTWAVKQASLVVEVAPGVVQVVMVVGAMVAGVVMVLVTTALLLLLLLVLLVVVVVVLLLLAWMSAGLLLQLSELHWQRVRHVLLGDPPPLRHVCQPG